jgi:hypothetical protein
MRRRVMAFVVSAVLGSVSSAESGGVLAPDPPQGFAGLWSHPYLTGFEPPASGPGPITNMSRRPDGRANFQRLVGNWRNPVLKPEAAQIVKRFGDMSLNGTGYETPSNQCWPGGVPYVFWDFLLEFLPEKDHITFVYRHGQEMRFIRLNSQHPANVKPSWYGDSIGHYEGSDTLVVDTVGIKRGPYAMLDMYGTPFTDALHIVERYRLVDYAQAADSIERNEKENTHAGGGWDYDPKFRGKVLQLTFTVDDPNVFITPWTATITYRPSVDPWPELICAENPHWFTMESESKIPTARKPDF